MAEVKWIKIVTDIFDDEKIRLIETLPEHDTIIVIWFKLLCLAGKSNSGGFLMMNDTIHYNDEMLVAIFNRPKHTVRLALDTFVNFGMIEIADQQFRIANWEKHQNIDGLDKIREQTRQRVARHRAKALGNKQSNVTCSDTVTPSNATEVEEEVEEDKEEDKEKDIPQKATPQIDYKSIVTEYNNICTSLPTCRKLTDKRKRSIKTFLHDFTLDELTTIFEAAQESNFLTGNNNNKWTASFDWVINKSNATKIIEGNYDNKGTGSKTTDALKEWYMEADDD